ncbi:MAG TPA: HEAT repeat domain-containing protein [Candidatus Sulfotelmatobacter sp.]|nr:HEAT repeat domain-containing protein [Candidatus Sulfotelmatobacter sp.]
MPGKREFEQQIAALDALRQAPETARLDPLRKALGHKNNYIAGKAADLVREFNLQQLMPDLLKAFDRFFENAEKSDPQCWAKNAISRALAAFELQDAKVFLRGMRHVQMEPVWGGRSDTAGTLRATCALALVQCRTLTEADVLAQLINLLSDKDKAVRTEVIRAIEQVGSPSAALLLRLRGTLANDEPEVLGACYSGVLRLEGKSAIPWAAGSLVAGNDAAAEAALAIAGSHSPEGFEVLRDQLKETSDPWFRSVLLSAIALIRQEPAMDYLIELVESESLHAQSAIEAIFRSSPSSDVLDRLEKAANTSPRLASAFHTLRNS